MRIAVIPTGRMEWQGLPRALARLFPSVDFVPIPTAEEIASNADIEFPIASLTSCDVARILHRPNAADRLISRAAQEALGDRRRKAADLVLILDDLELQNLHQPERVVDAVRIAVDRHVEALAFDARLRTRTAEALRNRVSFHLAVPMIESWLFADPAGPTRAGVPSERSIHLVQGASPEEFAVADPAYACDNGADCSAWHALPTARRRRHCPRWLKSSARDHDPKAYLCWLCRDCNEADCSRYGETRSGAAALAALDWGALLKSTAPAMPFLRALLFDIADAIDETPPWLVIGGDSPLLSRFAARTAPRLRNL